MSVVYYHPKVTFGTEVPEVERVKYEKNKTFSDGLRAMRPAEDGILLDTYEIKNTDLSKYVRENYTIFDIKGDGNCMYSSLAAWAYGSPNEQDRVRSDLCKLLNDVLNDTEEQYLPETRGKIDTFSLENGADIGNPHDSIVELARKTNDGTYIVNKCFQDNSWGNSYIMILACIKYKVCIMVGRRSVAGSMTFDRISAPDAQENTNVFWLYYTPNRHYDVMIPKNERMSGSDARIELADSADAMVLDPADASVLKRRKREPQQEKTDEERESQERADEERESQERADEERESQERADEELARSLMEQELNDEQIAQKLVDEDGMDAQESAWKQMERNKTLELLKRDAQAKAAQEKAAQEKAARDLSERDEKIASELHKTYLADLDDAAFARRLHAQELARLKQIEADAAIARSFV